MNRKPPAAVATAEPVLLVHAPGRDGELSCKLLGEAGHSCVPCRDDNDLVQRLGDGAGALLLAEEVLTERFVARLHTFISQQPPWSDLPVLVVAQREHRPRLEALAALGNASVLPRPMAPEALASAVGAALRARQRQFQVRDLLHNQREQARRKDEFMAMLAHELRNPLAPIRYAAHALQLSTLSPAKLTGMAALVERQVGHMGRIIDQLLDVTRVTRGIIHLQREPLDLAELTRQSIDSHAAAASVKAVTLHYDIDGPLWVHGDVTRLRQVVDNLLDNAIKFSPEGGVVRAELVADGADAVLRVVDAGDGIEPEVVPFLWEPFMQADRSLDRSRGGLGLGLALVKGLAQMHGGTVGVQSGGRGRGSTFTVRLPLAEAHAAQRESEGAGGGPPGGRMLRVLVAEDNIDAAETLRMILEVSGFDPVVEHSGTAAVDTARRQRPDAVVCDIGLPGMNGYEVARALRALPPGPPLLLVAVTGYGSPEDRAAALAAGFDAHFAKPVSPGELVALLERMAR